MHTVHTHHFKIKKSSQNFNLKVKVTQCITNKKTELTRIMIHCWEAFGFICAKKHLEGRLIARPSSGNDISITEETQTSKCSAVEPMS